MRDLIDEMAEAIYIGNRDPARFPPWESQNEVFREKMRAAVRSALQIVREPTPEMITAGANAHSPGYEYSGVVVADIFTAMIDAVDTPRR